MAGFCPVSDCNTRPSLLPFSCRTCTSFASPTSLLPRATCFLSTSPLLEPVSSSYSSVWHHYPKPIASYKFTRRRHSSCRQLESEYDLNLKSIPHASLAKSIALPISSRRSRLHHGLLRWLQYGGGKHQVGWPQHSLHLDRGGMDCGIDSWGTHPPP